MRSSRRLNQRQAEFLHTVTIFCEGAWLQLSIFHHYIGSCLHHKTSPIGGRLNGWSDDQLNLFLNTHYLEKTIMTGQLIFDLTVTGNNGVRFCAIYTIDTLKCLLSTLTNPPINRRNLQE